MIDFSISTKAQGTFQTNNQFFVADLCIQGDLHFMEMSYLGNFWIFPGKIRTY